MPSRKIISVLIVASALVASIILASGQRDTRKAGKQVVLTSEVSTRELSDSDWKGDLGSLPKTAIPSPATTTSNLTEQLSQSLMANYLALKQQDGLDGESAQTLVDRAAELASSATKDKYTSGNISLSADNSSLAIRNYGNAIGSVFKLNKPVQTKNEIQLFQQLLQNKDESKVKELKAIAQTYRNIAASLVKTTVPSSYASLHLSMTNNLEKMAQSVDMMAAVFEDPIAALSAITVYQESYSGYIGSLGEIKLRIAKAGAIYKQGESGYYLYFGI